MHPICRFLLTLACALALGACSSLPQPTPSHSDAIADYQRTPLAQLTQSALAGDSLSGFRLLPYGPNSVTTRIELARLATRSLDVQYYLLKGDHTGMTLMRALRDASLRGLALPPGQIHPTTSRQRGALHMMYTPQHRSCAIILGVEEYR